MNIMTTLLKSFLFVILTLQFCSNASARYLQADPIGINPDYSDPVMRVAMGMGTPLRGASSNRLNHPYGYVNSNPVLNYDPFGLATYMCIQPLHVLGGSGGKSGPDISINLLFHQFIAILNQDGSVTTGGQDRSGSLWSAGIPSKGDGEDAQNLQCREVAPDNECLEKCLKQAFLQPRPKYGLFGPGKNCQEWADETFESCKISCNIEK
jgi:hypothetical protein